MIAVACPHCQKKLKVKDELAGKKIHCPACKLPLDLPHGDNGFAPEEEATLPPSAPPLAREAATLPPSSSSSSEEATIGWGGEEPSLNVSPSTARRRYEVGPEIARGGMGAVLRAADCAIDREVALKYLLNQADQRQKARFIEEAKVTGQLEHPNIVPIHDLDLDADGQLFFSMKMVKGRSLAEILQDLDDDPKRSGKKNKSSEATAKEYTLGRLLTVFSNVCNALAYAHSRGVIHRDLKPANIMVGDFGEVYVMDWGLAKVLGAHPNSTEPERQRGAGPAASVTLSLGHASSVPINRQTLGELIQAGAIMGTPAYMPPEQARGEEVDQRADLYSLGAILYEIMTRTPPVGRGGDMMAILMRVVEAQIDPPAKRSPERARVGWIPSELSAIAMKALAREPADRYQTVEALRRDLELFLEGRSVSAKQDSFREMAWKLVKRNKGASITAASALVVLTVVAGFFLKSNYEARVAAETERGKAEVERGKAEEAHQAYQKQVKDSAPVLLRAAKAALNERKFDDALAQASLAVKSDPGSAEARLLTGELLITRRRFGEALSELEEFLKLKGQDADVLKLAEMCRDARPEEVASLLAFADFLTQRQQHALADGVLSGQGRTALEARQRVLEIFRKRIETAWPGNGNNLTMSNEGRFSLKGLAEVTDLTPLKGLPLTTLDLTGNGQIRTLEPTKGMPLTWLNLTYCTGVRDLTPLKGLPLTSLNLSYTQLQDLEPLKGLPLTYLNLSGCSQLRDLEPLKGLPLTYLNLSGCSQLRDLEPLKGMPLTSLYLANCRQVKNLEPLKDMPLTFLNLSDLTEVRDLEPLKGTPLKQLNIRNTGVTDLKPLQGMGLGEIRLTPRNISQGLEILRDMKTLKGIGIVSGGKPYPAAEFWKKYDDGGFNK